MLTKRAFNGEIKTIFHHFKGLSVAENCLRPDTAPLSTTWDREHEVVEYKLCTRARVRKLHTNTPLSAIIRIERLDPERLMYFQVNFDNHRFKRFYLYKIIFKINYIRILSFTTQPAFTCSFWAMETLEQCGKSI